MNSSCLKSQIVTVLTEQILQNSTLIQQAIDSAKESRNSDTKSSAGDKYETSREMAQIEIDKLVTQLQHAKNQLHELSKIGLLSHHTTIELGSLVYTNLGIYFVSLGLGKMIVNDLVIYAISLTSPLGNMFQKKRVGDTFNFQGKDFNIEVIE